ncbi:ComEA family DNA-binding protein [Janibacter limosus]|nr:ComEA family DNA-binding protein [Janibacter limosus]
MSRASEPSLRVTEILDEAHHPRPLELPSTLATGRYAVSRQAIIGVALVVALAVALLGGRYVMARQDAAPQPVATGRASDVGGPSGGALPGATPTPVGDAATRGTASDAATGAGTKGAATTGAAARVTVHIVGEVERPGVVTLPAGSRVDDALDQAGGATSEADLTGVNLARPLVDGEQVVVPAPGERVVGAPGAGTGAASGGAGAAGAGGAGVGDAGAGGAAAELVNLNTADLATLETLPGVGPVLAQRILDWRTEHGQFTAVEELGEVSGIGDKIYAQLSPKVTV